MSQMRTVRVDPRNRTARADAGATWGDFNYATHAFGLATTGGIISTTGIAGLTLGGGIGYLDARLRAVDRQPHLGRRGHRRRQVPRRERAARTRICSGGCAAAAATSASSPRSSTGSTRVDQVYAGPIFYNLEDAADGAAHVRRVHPGRTRGVRRVPGVPDRSAAAVHPGGPARRHALPRGRALGRAARAGRAACSSRSGRSRRSSPTARARCPTRR